MAEALRELPLKSRLFALDGIALTPCEAMERISLRCDTAAVKSVEKALGFKLPGKPKSSVGKGNVSALWIGPDEWLLLAEQGTAIGDTLSGVKSDLFSGVDISHRNTAIIISGDLAKTVLASGCPQNLAEDVFPVGACSRTMFGKAEVVIWRKGGNEFHLECWRSFSDYVWKFLVDAAKLA